MNRRDAINQIKQFGGRLDRFRKSGGAPGDGGRNAPKRAKASPKPNSRKTNVFNEQVRYAFQGALQDLKSKPLATFLTVMVIAISLTLPSVCYMVYKNVNQAASQYYPSPQITVYLQKTLDDDAAARVVGQLQAEQGVVLQSQIDAIGWTYIADDQSFGRAHQSFIDGLLAAQDLQQERKALAEVDRAYARVLEESQPLLELRRRIAAQLTAALPGDYQQNNLVFVPAARDSSSPLAGLRLQLRKNGEQRDLGDQSGGLRAVYALALVDDLDERTRIIGLDEPEAHLHPTSQRNLARLLACGDSQKIIATHSPDIIGEFEPDQIVVMHSGGQVVQPQRDFLSEDDKLLLHMWVRDRLEPLTADRVIVVEGITDRVLVEHCADVTKRNLDAYGIVLLEAGGCGDMPAWRRMFGEHGFQVPLAQLIDADAVPEIAGQYHVRADQLAAEHVWVSQPDLEGEYVRALGAERTLQALEHSGAFRASELKALCTARANGALDCESVAAFCRVRTNKTRAVIALLPHITAKVARRIESVDLMLNAVTRNR